VVIFPHCKINTGLHITARRSDGYHNLETVFFPVPFYDVLEAVPAADFKFTTSGADIPGNPADNICVKAFELMRRRFPQLPAVHLHLHKALPMGAGLGGGSANGTFTLRLLNQKFGLGMDTAALSALALELGSDCPFFAYNQPCYATGRGEVLTPVELDLSGYCVALVMPGIHVSTRDAFAGIEPAVPATSLQQLIQQPVSEWKHGIQNDFEKTVFGRHPQLAVIKQKLYDAGAVYASMSGSGSTVYGLFDKHSFDTAVTKRFNGMQVRVAELG
jgi:4-diphosphocytidyl-2-C-methyl-D-erythritol kinase